MDSETKIIETFKAAGKPLKAGELAEQSGLDKKEIDKILKKLKKEDRIESPQRCYYQVK
jgi:DNA-binding MarR family transcriptional regulator